MLVKLEFVVDYLFFLIVLVDLGNLQDLDNHHGCILRKGCWSIEYWFLGGHQHFMKIRY